MGRSTVHITNITPGTVIYEAPNTLTLPGALTSTSHKTLARQRKTKHPLLVLEVRPDLGDITVTYLASFNKSTSLANVDIEEQVKNMFVPVRPATKGFEHEPVSWAKHPGAPIPCWVSVRNRMALRGPEFTTFDDEKSFSVETASTINRLITVTLTSQLDLQKHTEK